MKQFVNIVNDCGFKFFNKLKKGIEQQVKTYMAVYFGTVFIAMFLVPIVSRLAKWYRLVDAPGPRKVHQIPIPRIGGIVFIVSTLALVLPVFFLNNDIGQSLRESIIEFIVLLVAASFIFIVGLIDDLRSVRGYIKLLCLIGASLAVCASGSTLRSIAVGTWFEIETGWAAWPLSIFWIVMITVCMSVIDGLDGLAAGIAAIVCGTIVLMALWSDQVAMAVLMMALLGSVTGFLFFNFYPAKIFMGDCGSMFLGFFIGAGSLVCQTKTHTLVGLAIPFLVMGVPIIDTCFVLISRRFIERRSMFASDRSHLHHHLLDLGLHHRTVVIILYAVTAISASIGLFTLTIEGGWSIGLLAVGLLLLFSMFACLHGRRYFEILMLIKRNLTIKRNSMKDRHFFEIAQVRLRESTSLQEWWDAVCFMGHKMNFQTIGLWNCRSGRYLKTFMWNVSDNKLKTGKTAKFTFPIHSDESTEWEIRIQASVNGFLELSGRQAMLIARLIDEFPLPKHDEGTGQLELFPNLKHCSSIIKKA